MTCFHCGADLYIVAIERDRIELVCNSCSAYDAEPIRLPMTLENAAALKDKIRAYLRDEMEES